ncbi:MAG: helix-turn-helix transcriptional regulator [Rikenellaceae bacterium]
MKERIFEIIQQNQLTAWKFAEMLNVQASSISHILSGRNKPSFDFIEKVLTKFPKINPDWLILGKGEMYRDDDTSPATEGANVITNKPSDESNETINRVDTTTPVELNEQNRSNNTTFQHNEAYNDRRYVDSRDGGYNEPRAAETRVENRDNLFNSIEIEKNSYFQNESTNVNRNNVQFTNVNQNKPQNFNADRNRDEFTNVITNVNNTKQPESKYDNTQDLLMSALATTDDDIEKIIIFYKGNRFAAYTPKK